MLNHDAFIKRICLFSSKKRKKTNEYFFKTGKGQYGEGDTFLGVSVPDTRKVALEFVFFNFLQIKKLLTSPLHEIRLAGLLILVAQFKQAKKLQDSKKQKQIFNFYLKNIKSINNWDLVDLSAPQILGEYLLVNTTEKTVWNNLLKTSHLWKNRIAIVSTFAFIKANNFQPTFKIAKQLLNHKEDLIHKAIGWMLREIWKQDNLLCEIFLKTNYNKLPRTTLRYAIERMGQTKRLGFLKKKF